MSIILTTLTNTHVLTTHNFWERFFPRHVSMLLIELIVDRIFHVKHDDFEDGFNDHDRKGLEDDAFIPSSHANQNTFSRLGFISFLTMFLHNLPEGISVALSTSADLKLGIGLGVAIFVHNILEGLVVSIPIYIQTRSSLQVIFYSFLNGLA